MAIANLKGLIRSDCQLTVIIFTPGAGWAVEGGACLRGIPIAACRGVHTAPHGGYDTYSAASILAIVQGGSRATAVRLTLHWIIHNILNSSYYICKFCFSCISLFTISFYPKLYTLAVWSLSLNRTTIFKLIVHGKEDGTHGTHGTYGTHGIWRKRKLNTWQFNSAKTIFAFSCPPQLRHREKLLVSCCRPYLVHQYTI